MNRPPLTPDLAYRNALMVNSTAYIVAMLASPKFNVKKTNDKDLNTMLSIAINMAKAQLTAISQVELPDFVPPPSLTDEFDVSH